MQRYVCALALVLVNFAPHPARAQTSNVCTVLAQNPNWNEALMRAHQNWRVSPIMAILDQESRFNPSARGAGASGLDTARNFGFAQANLRTWNWFLRDTGRASGARTDFALSADFVGWHFATMERRIGADRDNVTAHYLVYKMGEGGYKRGAPASVRAAAGRIAARGRTFDDQLARCRV
jgi:hypothetical protein